MEPFATNLRKRAEELGISHAEAARRSGLSERRYGNYVSGRREPDLATLVRIAGALSTTPDILLAANDATPRSEEAVLRDRIASASSGLGRHELKMLATMVEALAAARS